MVSHFLQWEVVSHTPQRSPPQSGQGVAEREGKSDWMDPSFVANTDSLEDPWRMPEEA